MKKSKLITKVADGKTAVFETKNTAATIAIRRGDLSDDMVRIGIGWSAKSAVEGAEGGTSQAFGAPDLRELARKLKALADDLDPPEGGV